MGCCRDADPAEIIGLVRQTLAGAGITERRVRALATAELRAREPGILAAAEELGVPLRCYPVRTLATVEVPHPSATTDTALGTPSVAEAAALLGAGEPYGDAAELLVPKRKSAPAGRPSTATCAVAQRAPAALLRHHGDAEVRSSPAGPHGGTEGARGPESSGDEDSDGSGSGGSGGSALGGSGLTDLAVNVRSGTPPAWLVERLTASLAGLAAYPDGRAARRAVARRHGLAQEQVLLTAGAAEAFVLLARTLRARRAAVVHPQFTEPEAALRDAGTPVSRVLLREHDGFRLGAVPVPEDADLVVVGNPTNPTSVLHPAAELARLAAPGRTLVVDEAFIDAVPGEAESLVPLLGRLPGRLVVLRSLTKTWGLAGLRIGYVLSDPRTVELLGTGQPLWPVSSPALVAAQACSTPEALAEAEAAARTTAAHREHLLRGLGGLTRLRPARVAARAPFVLVHHPDAPRLRALLRERGFAVRRADTFPGLGREWLRLAVRDPATSDRLLHALAELEAREG
ncbi:Rv2231c family pyridoxal phosphate-dependent protein CobC [Streptomyces sp. XM4193]|nr:Rv2231c family pyridoxal phosphate-dependent protein CobC [Streptomyces sp. XM4193]MCK1796514.1 Rv2231c family pyridoxal phosphate-dependent protein CobC [Streptomyces sp. XM4193]